MVTQLSGCRVANDEHEARQAYPHVTWEHPQLYPGLMVPVWAIELRQAADRCGLSGFGRALLQYVRRMFPRESSLDEEKRAEALHEAEDKEDYDRLVAEQEREDRDAVVREGVALVAVAAAIAVLDLYTGVISEQLQSDPPNTESGRSRNAREALAMKVLDVLEAAGMTYARPSKEGPFAAATSDERRYAINAEAERVNARSKLLVAVRIPGRDVPRARFA